MRSRGTHSLWRIIKLQQLSHCKGVSDAFWSKGAKWDSKKGAEWRVPKRGESGDSKKGEEWGSKKGAEKGF